MGTTGSYMAGGGGARPLVKGAGTKRLGKGRVNFTNATSKARPQAKPKVLIIPKRIKYMVSLSN